MSRRVAPPRQSLRHLANPGTATRVRAARQRELTRPVAQVLQGITRRDSVDFPVLVPNMKGFEKAVASGAKSVAVVGIPSETFSHKNLNCSVAEGVRRTIEVVHASVDAGVPCRGYVSCALGCPFEGPMAPEAVAQLATELFEAGCYEIAIADTIGCGTPGVRPFLPPLLPPPPSLSLCVER